MKTLNDYKGLQDHYKCSILSNNRKVRKKANSELKNILEEFGFRRDKSLLLFHTNKWSLDNTVYAAIECGIEHHPGSKELGIKSHKYGRVSIDITGQYQRHPKITSIIDTLKSWQDKYVKMDNDYRKS